ncbi:MAG: hypothetical protein WBX25_06945 [Rhodomicrobium sp.]
MTGTMKAPYRPHISYRGTGDQQQSTVTHKFAVGQSVHLTLRSYHSAAAGLYKIRRLVPISETDTNPRYRIKSEAEKHERVAAEYDLTLSNSVQLFLPGQGL